MQSVNASAVVAALIQVALESSVFIAILTLMAAPAMKHFARPIPILSAASVLFASGYTVFLVIMIGWMMLRVAEVELSNALSGVTTFAGMFVVGWIVNRYAARNYGIPTKFPSLGFKVMLSMLAGTWILTGIGYTLWIMAR